MDSVYSPEEIKFIVILTVVMVAIVAIATAVSVCISRRRDKQVIDRESLTTNEYSLTADVPEIWSVQGHYHQIDTWNEWRKKNCLHTTIKQCCIGFSAASWFGVDVVRTFLYFVCHLGKHYIKWCLKSPIPRSVYFPQRISSDIYWWYVVFIWWLRIEYMLIQ